MARPLEHEWGLHYVSVDVMNFTPTLINDTNHYLLPCNVMALVLVTHYAYILLLISLPKTTKSGFWIVTNHWNSHFWATQKDSNMGFIMFITSYSAA